MELSTGASSRSVESKLAYKDEEILIEEECLFSVLAFCDFFCSIFSFWVTLILLIPPGAVSPSASSALNVIGACVIAFSVSLDRRGLVAFLLPTLCAAALLILATFTSILRQALSFRSSCVPSCSLKACPRPSLQTIFRVGLGVCLSGLGLLLFVCCETDANYKYVHSSWHVLMAFSLLLVLPPGPIPEEARARFHPLWPFCCSGCYEASLPSRTDPIQLDELVDEEDNRGGIQSGTLFLSRGRVKEAEDPRDRGTWAGNGEDEPIFLS
ncbi:unnamed protein product [Cyprideis torosa]|uniref:Uncharacterized protein n=1 Tax=Cyprideis torosa TaxID=163714 RepID=A0A7R8ZQF4_9CRUS|nr:unnamed protein product [Cyprideis torosa]CAG0891949.1 unnamed protein product [Cyprideis torosa]